MAVVKPLLKIALGAALLVTGCDAAVPSPSVSKVSPSASASEAAFQPTFAEAPCPEDVSTNVVIGVTCGFVTVLEDRSRPAGQTIQLFVARFDPPGGTSTPDPIITLGHLAAQDGYGEMSGGGQRTHRVLYLMDPRGIGHSTPSLACPEVPAVGPDLAGLRLRDPARVEILQKAVTACHDRLVGQGIQLADYDLAANAADLDDVRGALDIDKWNVMSNGDASRIAFEVARRYPAGLRSLIIDSPSLPAPDFLTDGPAWLDLAISQVVAICGRQPACGRSFPDVAAMIRSAIAKLDAKPIELDIDGTVDAIRLGHPIHAVIDGAALVRILRFGLGSGGGSAAGRALLTVRDAVDGKLRRDDPNILALVSDVGDCLGILTNCELPNLGALYSIICRDYATQVDQTRLTASLDGRSGYADVFSPSPLLAACSVWGVPAATGGPDGSPTGGVPTLVLRGSLDPFSASVADVTAATQGSPNVFVLAIPNQSYNVLGFTECPRAIRNAWIDAITAPPADTSCLAAIPAPNLAP
jgi:pimeloyl-ACP methyl ester carboxylesterase